MNPNESFQWFHFSEWMRFFFVKQKCDLKWRKKGKNCLSAEWTKIAYVTKGYKNSCWVCFEWNWLITNNTCSYNSRKKKRFVHMKNLRYNERIHFYFEWKQVKSVEQWAFFSGWNFFFLGSNASSELSKVMCVTLKICSKDKSRYRLNGANKKKKIASKLKVPIESIRQFRTYEMRQLISLSLIMP